MKTCLIVAGTTLGLVASLTKGYTLAMVEERAWGLWLEEYSPLLPRGRVEPDAVPGLHWFRATAKTGIATVIYEPLVCLILHGRKATRMGDRRVEMGPGDCIVVSHRMPVEARILEASLERPFLSMVVRLELSELRSLYDEVDVPESSEDASAYAVAKVSEPVLSTLGRYLRLIDEPGAHRVMLPLIRRELHYRLLCSEQGRMLRTLLVRDSHESKVAQAIRHLRDQFREPLEVPDLARSVGMSTSAFHKHFKRITSTTPLQYQKELRLMEAERLLGSSTDPVTSVAYEVGYESPTQFSREFARKFGVSPRDHRSRALGEIEPAVS